MKKITFFNLFIFLVQFNLFGQSKINDSTIINAVVLEESFVGDVDIYCTLDIKRKLSLEKLFKS